MDCYSDAVAQEMSYDVDGTQCPGFSACDQPDEICSCNAYVQTTGSGCFRVGSPPAGADEPQSLFFLQVEGCVEASTDDETSMDDETSTDETCVDDEEYCREILDAFDDMCTSHDLADIVRERCPVTCGLCSVVDDENSFDDSFDDSGDVDSGLYEGEYLYYN